MEHFLRVQQVATKLGIGISTVWAKVKSDKTFPQPYKISPRVTVWKCSEVENWMNLQCQNEVNK